MPLCSLGFRSIVVVSSNDPYVSLERAQLFASGWGSQLVNIGVGGHIATSDRFGEGLVNGNKVRNCSDS